MATFTYTGGNLTASAGTTGSGLAVAQTSPTFITPVLGAATATSLAFSSTSGIIGTTTNNNAAAGSVGEVVTSTVAIGSPVALTDVTAADVTSISLTAGDWDVWGNVKCITSGAVTVFYLNTWISTVSATQNADNTLVGILQYGTEGLLLTSTILGVAPITQRISLAGTTTIYLGCTSHFTGGTSQSAYGVITARRRR